MPLTDADAAAAVSRMLNRLRSESDRRPAAGPVVPGIEQGPHEMAAGLARMVLSPIDLDDPDASLSPAEVLRAVAVALVGTRQSFLAVRDLSDLQLSEILPFVQHLSTMAESFVRLSDELAVHEMTPASGDCDEWRKL